MKANSISLLIIFCFAFATGAKAQKKLWLEASIEPKSSTGGDYFVPADANSSNPAWVPMGTAFTLKVNAGLAAHYYFNERIGVSAGVSFSTAGHEYYNYMWSISGFTIEFKRKVALNYAEAPVQFHYIHSPAKKISLIATAGGYVAMLISYKDENKFFLYDGSKFFAIAEGKNYTQSVFIGADTETESATLQEEPYNAYDYGAIIGIGVQFKILDTKYLTLLPEYRRGFMNIKNKTATFIFQNNTYLLWQNTYNNSPNAEEDYINSSFGLKIGLRFAL